MSRTFLASDLLDRVQLLGDYAVADGDYSDAAVFMSSGTLYGFMDTAFEHAWGLWSDADEGWNMQRVSLTQSAGSASFVDLPADCHKIRSVEVQFGLGCGWEPLRRANAGDDCWTTAVGGYPYAYREFPTQLELLPNNSCGEVRLAYCPYAQHIVDGTETVPGTDGFDQVVVLRTLLLSRGIREDLAVAEVRTQLSDIETRFRESIRRRDRSSPTKLRPRGRNRPWRPRTF